MHLDYDSSFRVSRETVSGASATPAYAASFGFNDDGLSSSAGDLTFSTLPSSANNWLKSGTSLGTAPNVVTDLQEIDAYNALLRYTTSFNSTVKYFESITERDNVNRITKREETVEGVLKKYEYTYDDTNPQPGVAKPGVGRLTDVVVKDSAGNVLTASHYDYDDNGNRTQKTGTGGTIVAGAANAQDQLPSYGDNVYEYTQNGELKKKANGTNVTTYTCDPLGNLKSVALPG